MTPPEYQEVLLRLPLTKEEVANLRQNDPYLRVFLDREEPLPVHPLLFVPEFRALFRPKKSDVAT